MSIYKLLSGSHGLARPDAGALYWLGTRYEDGVYLDGGKTYRLMVPQPVPARLFWSVGWFVYFGIYGPEAAASTAVGSLPTLRK